LSDIEAKLEAIEGHFRKGSKRLEAARYIVRQNRIITSDERKAIIQEIPISYKTLQGLLTKLRKMGVYPPQANSDIPNHPQPPENPQETSQAHQNTQPPLHDYVMKKDFDAKFEILNDTIHNLASLFNEDPPANPGNYEKEEEMQLIQPVEMELIQPVEMELIQPVEMELIQPVDRTIQDPSITRKSIWLKPKTAMYFDMARQGLFANYVGTRDMSPFTQFDGNLSDFFNIIVDDYFIRLFNADIGLLMRRYA